MRNLKWHAVLVVAVLLGIACWMVIVQLATSGPHRATQYTKSRVCYGVLLEFLEEFEADENQPVRAKLSKLDPIASKVSKRFGIEIASATIESKFLDKRLADVPKDADFLRVKFADGESWTVSLNGGPTKQPQ